MITFEMVLLPHTGETNHPQRIACDYAGCDQLATIAWTQWRIENGDRQTDSGVDYFCPTHAVAAARWASAPATDRDVDHPACPDSAHDRRLPDPLDGQAVAPDGLLACNDCGRPAFYCTTDENYHHVDRAATCFLIRD